MAALSEQKRRIPPADRAALAMQAFFDHRAGPSYVFKVIVNVKAQPAAGGRRKPAVMVGQSCAMAPGPRFHSERAQFF